MYAITFDLIVAELQKRHDKGVSYAYAEVASVLSGYGFNRIQGSVYVTDDENMANLFMAIQALKNLDWFPSSVRDIRAFRIEQWSDFTPVVKG